MFLDIPAVSNDLLASNSVFPPSPAAERKLGGVIHLNSPQEHNSSPARHAKNSSPQCKDYSYPGNWGCEGHTALVSYSPLWVPLCHPNNGVDLHSSKGGKSISQEQSLGELLMKASGETKVVRAPHGPLTVLE